jgi:hypothetical protein
MPGSGDDEPRAAVRSIDEEAEKAMTRVDTEGTIYSDAAIAHAVTPSSSGHGVQHRRAE